MLFVAEQIGSQLGGYQTERSRYRRVKRDLRGAARRTRRDAWPTRSTHSERIEMRAQDNCFNLPMSDRNLLNGLETADNVHHVHHKLSIAIPTIEISQYLLFS